MYCNYIDGKDEESTSEEINYVVALIQWGKLINNNIIYELGQTLYTILHITLHTYFLLTSDNKVMPPQIISNHITGILTEFKITYQTWFDGSTAAIHGIQMLPFIQSTPHIRSIELITEEWNDIYSHVDRVLNDNTNKWKSVLLMNYAIINSNDAFIQLSDRSITMDDGLSHAYALHWCLTVNQLSHQLTQSNTHSMTLAQHNQTLPYHHASTHWSNLYKAFLSMIIIVSLLVGYVVYSMSSLFRYRLMFNFLRRGIYYSASVDEGQPLLA